MNDDRIHTIIPRETNIIRSNWNISSTDISNEDIQDQLLVVQYVSMFHVEIHIILFTRDTLICSTWKELPSFIQIQPLPNENSFMWNNINVLYPQQISTHIQPITIIPRGTFFDMILFFKLRLIKIHKFHVEQCFSDSGKNNLFSFWLIQGALIYQLIHSRYSRLKAIVPRRTNI